MATAPDIIISTLSILVTILIGWQIYNYITLTKLIDSKINKRFEEFTGQYIKDRIKTHKINQDLQYATMLDLLYPIKMQALGQDSVHILHHCFLVRIDIVINIGTDEEAKGVYDSLEELIKKSNNLSVFSKEQIDELRTKLEEFAPKFKNGFKCLNLLNSIYYTSQKPSC